MVEAITRWIGVSITLVGAFIVSPAATVALIGRWQRRTVQAMRRVEDAVRRVIRRPRTIDLAVHDSVAVLGTASATLTAHGMASGQAPDPSVEGRVDRLEKRADAMDAQVAEVTTRADADRAAFREGLGQAREEQRAGTDRLHARLDQAERQAVEVDAAALPVVALGVLVSGSSPDAHRLPLVLWALLLVAAVTLTLRGVLGARTRRHAHALVPSAASRP